MAQQETTLRIKAIVEGGAEVQRLKRSAQTLGNQAKQSASDISFLAKETRVLAGATNRTENELRDSINIFRELRANVDMTSKEYRELTRDINKAERALAKSGKSGKGAGGRFAGVGQSFGAVAGAARISPEAGIGAGIGALAGGGLPGALAGAAIGSAVTPIREQMGELADFNAKLNLAKITLAEVSGNQEEFNKHLNLARQVSQDYSVSLLSTLDGLSKITAAAKANNLSFEETEQIYRGMVAAGVAFGGSQADLDAIIRATTQVLSKGKVTAEEMQGQIGERLPGAVAKFAQATGRSLPQLAKDFEQGKVTIEDFVAFTRKQVDDYDQIARTIGESPEKAGLRLQIALETAGENFGGFFQNAGASIQDFSTKVLTSINKNAEAISKFIVGTLNIADKTIKIYTILIKAHINYIKNQVEAALTFFKPLGIIFKTQLQLIKLTIDGLNLLGKAIGKAAVENLDFAKEIEEVLNTDRFKLEDFQFKFDFDKDELNETGDAIDKLDKKTNDYLDGAKAGFEEYKEGLKDVAGAMSKTIGNAFQKLEDTLVDFVQTGKFAFKDLARSIIADLTRIAVQQTIMKPLTGFLGGIFPNIFGSAKGNVFAANGIQKFARGGIVDKPTVFPFKNGIGLMGEAGAEAILPLKRGKGGRLGVEGGGGGSTVVNVSVDASGTSVEGNEEQSRQFGQVLAAAIQAEIIDQKRPGGLLSS